MATKYPKCNADNPDTKQFCGNCGTQLSSIKDMEVTETIETPKEELTTGSTFAGHFQIIEELGRGGLGPSLNKDYCCRSEPPLREKNLSFIII